MDLLGILQDLLVVATNAEGGHELDAGGDARAVFGVGDAPLRYRGLVKNIRLERFTGTIEPPPPQTPSSLHSISTVSSAHHAYDLNNGRYGKQPSANLANEAIP